MKQNTQKFIKILMMLALIIFFCLPGLGLANIVNFDDLSTPFGDGISYPFWGDVPTSYAGYTWTNFQVVQNNSFKSLYLNSGDFPSLDNAVYNGGAYQTVTVDFGETRNVLDAYFRAWSFKNDYWFISNDAVGSATTVTLYGYNGNNLIYTLPVDLSYTEMVYTPINFLGVTKIDFVNGAGEYEYRYWLMDNLNTVPLPGTLLLLGSGLAGLGLWRGRKRFKV
jgi:hypothetical protein